MPGSEPMESTKRFDAAVVFSRAVDQASLSVLLDVEGNSVPSFLSLYDERTDAAHKTAFVQIILSQPLSLKWKQSFTIRSPDSREVWGEGTVLDPCAEKIVRRLRKRRVTYLQGLLGNEKEMLLALIQFKGIFGVQEKEAFRFGHHTKSSLLELSQELEAEGKIRILEFSPLFVISQSALSFLCDKVLDFLGQYHEKHPGDVGAQREKIRNRFDVHTRILTLALKFLVQNGKIKIKGDRVSLLSFEMALLPEEEKTLEWLEGILLKDKLRSLSLDELQRSFRFSSEKLDKLLALLTERKKIVLGRDGFILHSRWLDEVVRKVRNSGKKELTVSEFKEMTGLTRKYAIPLLEFLDQMGITKRRGSVREILGAEKSRIRGDRGDR
jgi:selenocysteine-specific elongation factor